MMTGLYQFLVASGIINHGRDGTDYEQDTVITPVRVGSRGVTHYFAAARKVPSGAVHYD